MTANTPEDEVLPVTPKPHTVTHRAEASMALYATVPCSHCDGRLVVCIERGNVLRVEHVIQAKKDDVHE